MLLKVLKYDLKFTYKNLIIFYTLSLFFALLGRICSIFDTSGIMLILSKINNGIAISMIISVIINNLMRVWARLVLNFYKDESYLTHTLPVKKSTLYLSKVLCGIITMLTSTLVIAASLLICYYSKENIELLKNSLNLVASLYESSITSLLLQIFTLLFLEFTFILLTGYIGIILGHKTNNNKMLKSCLYGFLVYMALSIIILLVIYISGLFNSDIMSIFTSTTFTLSVFKTTLLIVMITYLILIVLEYIIGLKTVNKGVNID